jgi:hypothetical protein
MKVVTVTSTKTYTYPDWMSVEECKIHAKDLFSQEEYAIGTSTVDNESPIRFAGCKGIDLNSEKPDGNAGICPPVDSSNWDLDENSNLLRNKEVTTPFG